ncbi:sulfite exporter TauE/SafE family protein [Streptomyces sp. NPDC056527]|uniref:urease accessory protein UreH domain-containing protein n=1 Tax=Streptomyces sp. NPDC056527 TaxID=3345853 RepID=UPI0036A15530
MPSSFALFLTGAGTGLLAGGASCAAVQGGLLAGAVARRTPASPPPSVGGPMPTPTVGNLAPVGAFLAGKLLSHTVFGALLGAFGKSLQPSPRTQAVLLIVAGAFMVLFALDLFGIKAVGRLVPRPPASFSRLVRRSAKTTSALTPALVGFATVLVPCGVTLSVELIAITSGSPLAGAAVMAGFVLGTAPLFTILGYVFRRAGGSVSAHLRSLTGVVVLAVAVWTIASAVQAGGWASFDMDRRPEVAASPQPVAPRGLDAPQDSPVRVDASGKQIITLTVTDFYETTAFSAKAGVSTTLVLRGKDAGGCARAFTIPALGVQEIVQQNGDTPIDLGTPKTGKLRFSCAMGMQTGTIDFA